MAGDTLTDNNTETGFSEAQETTQALLEGQLASNEAQPDSKAIEFTDKQGVERRPYAEAPECYATPEIQEIVGEHFAGVNRTIGEVEREVDAIASGEASTEESFNPLNDELLTEIKALAKAQLPLLTEVSPVLVQKEITEGRIFKKTRTVSAYEDQEVPVIGHTASAADESQKKIWDQTGYTARTSGEYVRTPEARSELEKNIAYKLKSILTSDERLLGDAPDKKLPLLAKKLLDAGISVEEIDELSWEDVEGLVPEVEPWFNDIHQLEESFANTELLEALHQQREALWKAQPNACETIARVYYDEATLQRLSDVYDKIEKVRCEIWNSGHPENPQKFLESTFIADQHESMAAFFDYALSADTLLIHGTTFAPRIIKSGALKPAQAMTDDELTFSTNRTNIAGATAAGTVHGSRAVHWAQAGSYAAYARNERFDEARLRESIASRLNVEENHPWVDQEVSKGGVGAAMMVMRLGDVVAHTPYGGYADVSFGSRPDDKRPMGRRGAVELTDKGVQQLQARNKESRPGSDIAYIATPLNRTNEEIFDYEYPVDEMMIGIPEADPDTIPQALRDAGWTEDQIAETAFTYDRHIGEEDELQQAAYQNPKYPNMIIATLSSDI